MKTSIKLLGLGSPDLMYWTDYLEGLYPVDQMTDIEAIKYNIQYCENLLIDCTSQGDDLEEVVDCEKNVSALKDRLIKRLETLEKPVSPPPAPSQPANNASADSEKAVAPPPSQPGNNVSDENKKAVAPPPPPPAKGKDMTLYYALIGAAILGGGYLILKKKPAKKQKVIIKK